MRLRTRRPGPKASSRAGEVAHAGKPYRTCCKAWEGKWKHFYYAFGDVDAYVIVDAPDNVTAAAVSLAVNGGGGATVKTVPLLSVEEMDQAAKKTVHYRAPGQQ